MQSARRSFRIARAQLSNGFDQIDPDLRFDLIASNLPAKVGSEMISLYLHDASNRLRLGGRLYLVTINGLRQYLKRNLIEIFGNYEKLKQGTRYTVALACLENATATENRFQENGVIA